MDTCLSLFIDIIIFIYMNNSKSLKSITLIAETCTTDTKW